MSAPATTRTLAQRLAEGTLPFSEALRTGTQLAQILRKLHDTGHVHGAVSPGCVTLTAAGVELAPGIASSTPTPYTAPEVIAGKPADAASDIFSFGTVLFEMLTGCRAFDGDDSATISALVTEAQPASTGHAVADRLVAACLAKDPAARPLRMQKVTLELKTLNMLGWHTGQAAPRRDTVLETALRSEIAKLEARIDERLEDHRQQVARSQRATAETVSGLGAELGKVASQLDIAQEYSARSQKEIHAAGEGILDQVQQHLDATAEHVQRLEQNLSANQDRVQKLEETSLNHQHLEQIGLNLEVHAGRMQQLEASLAATHGAMELFEREAASHDHVEQIARAVESCIVRTDALEAALVRLRDAFEQNKNTADSREQLIRLAEQVDAQTTRVDGLQKTVAETVNQHFAVSKQQIDDIHELITKDVQTLESAISQQAKSIESLRGAMSQTDDVVERTVEALESLQLTVLEHSENRARAFE